MNTEYKVVTNMEEAEQYIARSPIVAFDFETAPNEDYRTSEKAALDPARSHICSISLSVAEGSAIMIPVAHKVGSNVSQEEFFSFLTDLMTDTSIVKVAHNIAFESMFCYQKKIVIQPPVYDTMCAAQLTMKSAYTFRSLADSGLKTLAKELCKEELPSFAEVVGERHFDELDPSDPETIRYSCADADIALRLYHICNGWFDRYLPGHRRVCEQLESPSAVFVGIMKVNGVPMDVDAMQRADKHADQQIGRLRYEIRQYVGDINIGSNCGTAAFRNFIYGLCALPVLKYTEKLKPSLDDEALLMLQDYCREHRKELAGLFDLVMDYRKWQKLKSTYLEGYLKYVNPVTRCMHPDLMQLATETGRFACRRPNMQNIPQKGEDPIGIRNFIAAPDGWSVMEIDYSQAEIRLCAYLSQDKVLLDAYEHGTDVHAITTAAVFGIPLEEAMDHSRPDYKHRRTVAKGTMFGIMYGIGGAGLSRNLYTNAGVTLSKDQCNEYIDGILKKYTGMAAWQLEMKAKANQCGYIETAMGRRRYLPGIRSSEYGQRSMAERMAINTPVQGLGADCLKHAMVVILPELVTRPYIRPILTVHDSLVFLVRDDKVDEASSLLKRCMEAPLPLPGFVPLVAEVSAGKRYGELT